MTIKRLLFVLSLFAVCTCSRPLYAQPAPIPGILDGNPVSSSDLICNIGINDLNVIATNQAVYLLGEEGASLVRGTESTGVKRIEWKSPGVAPGVYFYRLDATSPSDRAGHFSSVRKTILLK